ncbi:uncharacterized protein LOC106953879 isoform X1 [Poecilia latipinna]|uniref:uncharacterized protein LOC106953879 isoform X1 n=1 Tax=Poecilia latipinna TaxID=48699 RepID=UPI00072DE506|nr:PREDICTED: uncharacterized protein LOC106953879 isoform X1 [Poecilia latipinna]
MLRLLCCCFVSSDSLGERQPLLQPGSPSEVTEAESARRAPSAHNGKPDAPIVKRSGKLVMRRVNVPELDHRFTDMAEIFNEQQAHYEAMVGHIRKLKQSCDITDVDNLAVAECIGALRKEHETTYRVSLKMKGYDFSLILDPVGPEGETEEEPLPLALQRAQNEFRGISDSAKATVSKGAKLLQLMDWLLRSNSQMVEQVKGAAETYQEQGRLNDNLEENIKEVRRAKELSQRYRKQADEVYTEAVQIAGIDV